QAWRDAKKPRPEARTDAARTIAYFCAVLSESELKASPDKHATVVANFTKLLTDKIKPILPATAKDAAGAASFVIKRYEQANWEASDRYTLSLPGSIKHRISPLDPS